VAAVLALTERDAERLRTLAAGAGRVEVVPAPFPQELPAGPPLSGWPAVVLMGSGGWLPNEESVRWFADSVWPRVAARLPEAVLHLFGGPRCSGEGIVPHPPPAESADAFARGSVLVVPLRIASGVRMKVLEAWARGVAVVGTAEGLAGLVTEPGQGALIAGDAESLAAALARLAEEPGAAAALTEAGRKILAERHCPEAVAARLAAVYTEVSR
jgi:glycosyltransferase involved in cell wall biosynthesis